MELHEFIQMKLDLNEGQHDYAVATETVRCWIEEWEEINKQLCLQI